ncbi:MAG: ABC transporter permease [Salinivirgaceae bacterium]|nr:ABC transporter permease [Salinivirgaceae bacterium]
MDKLIKMAWRNIWRNKRRTLITIASIFFAVFFAVIMRAFQLGTYEHMIHQAIESFTGYIQIQDKEFFDDPSLDNSFKYGGELANIVENNKEIKVAVPRVASFSLASTGMQSKGVLVTGIDPLREKELSNPEIRIVKYRLTIEAIEKIMAETKLPKKQLELLKIHEKGSFSSWAGLALGLSLSGSLEDELKPIITKHTKFEGQYLKVDDDGVLVSDRLSKYLMAEVGDTITLLGLGYHGVTAAGIFPVRGIVKIPSPDLDNKLVYMTLSKSQQFFDLGNRITSLNINLYDPDEMMEVQSELLASINSDKYTVKNWEEFNPTMKQQIEGDSVGGVIFIGILYFIVLFGIFGTVLMMVAERKREFGVMVAIGMKKAKLVVILFIEMIFLGFIGMATGLGAAAPLIVLGNKNPIRMTGEMAKMYEDMGFDPVMPLAWFDNYFVWQGVIIMIMVILACIFPLEGVRKMKVMNALKA